LSKIWPGDDFDGLIEEAQAAPDTKWDKTEQYFIKLGAKKKFEIRIKLWIFKLGFKKTLTNLETVSGNVLKGLNALMKD
jgi:hypothetical protein